MEIAYYPGCSLCQSSRFYNNQTNIVLNKIGLYLKEIDDWSCCGATSAGKVDDFMAVAMPARNIGLAEAEGFGEMVIPCSACYSRTLIAQQRLSDVPSLKEDINQELAKKVNGGIKISSILEVLQEAAENGRFSDRLVNKLEGLKPVCYYGCMLTRFPYDVPVPDNVENPQAMELVLEAIGIKALDWNYKTRCCGASAVINDPKTAAKLMAAIMKDAVSRGANCFVVTCPMCQMNMDAQQDHFCKQHGIKERLPVYFLTELLGLSLGITYHELQIDRHFIDGSRLL